jgi:hypothetical protein
MKFNNVIEKTDESSINLDKDILGEEVDQKERRRYVRKEMKCYNDLEIFQQSSDNVQKNLLFNPLMDMFTKANQLLNVIYKDNYDKYIADKAKMASMASDKIEDYKKQPGVQAVMPN